MATNKLTIRELEEGKRIPPCNEDEKDVVQHFLECVGDIVTDERKRWRHLARKYNDTHSCNQKDFWDKANKVLNWISSLNKRRKPIEEDS